MGQFFPSPFVLSAGIDLFLWNPSHSKEHEIPVANPPKGRRRPCYRAVLLCTLLPHTNKRQFVRGCVTRKNCQKSGSSLRQRWPGGANSTFFLYFVLPYQGFFLFSCKISPSFPDPVGQNPSSLTGFFTKKIQFVHFLLLFFSIWCYNSFEL